MLDFQILEEMRDLKNRSGLRYTRLIAQIQKMGDLAREPEIEEAFNLDIIIDVHSWGVNSIDGVYRSKGRTMRARRKTALMGSLEKICGWAKREVPAIEQTGHTL